jgi:hypothetical protein
MNTYNSLYRINIYAKLVLFIEYMVYVEPTCFKQLQYGSRVFLPDIKKFYFKKFSALQNTKEISLHLRNWITYLLVPVAMLVLQLSQE